MDNHKTCQSHDFLYFQRTFNVYLLQERLQAKRERRERRATKTLAIVLGEICVDRVYSMGYLQSTVHNVQGSTKLWTLGCVNSRPAARGSLEARVTQPWAHILVVPFKDYLMHLGRALK